eukprot:sb/3471542/
MELFRVIKLLLIMTTFRQISEFEKLLQLGGSVSLGLFRLVDGIIKRKSNRNLLQIVSHICRTIRDMEHDSGDLIRILVKRFLPVEVYYNEYRKVLGDCAIRRQTSVRQLLGAAPYSTFTKIRPVAELFIVDPNIARRLFETDPYLLELTDLSKRCHNKEQFNHPEKLHELSEEGRVLSLYRK